MTYKTNASIPQHGGDLPDFSALFTTQSRHSLISVSPQQEQVEGAMKHPFLPKKHQEILFCGWGTQLFFLKADSHPIGSATSKLPQPWGLHISPSHALLGGLGWVGYLQTAVSEHLQASTSTNCAQVLCSPFPPKPWGKKYFLLRWKMTM